MAGTLGAAEQLPGGGRKYPVQCDGIKTTIKNVLALPDNVAGAWHKPMTEATPSVTRRASPHAGT